MLREIQKTKEHTLVRRLKKMLILCAILFVFIIIFLVFFKVKDIEVKGVNYYSKSDVITMVTDNKDNQNSVLLFLKYKYFKSVNIPFIQDIDIEIANRNKIVICVYEKAMIGCIEYMDQYMYFDKDGTIIESANKQIEDVPIVMGLQFDEMLLHKQLNVKKKELYDIILNITQQINKYKVKVDKIVFTKETEVNLVVEDITVLLGKHAVYDEPIANLKNILPKLKDKKGELDMKTYDESTKRVIFKTIN